MRLGFQRSLWQLSDGPLIDSSTFNLATVSSPQQERVHHRQHARASASTTSPMLGMPDPPAKIRSGCPGSSTPAGNSNETPLSTCRILHGRPLPRHCVWQQLTTVPGRSHVRDGRHIHDPPLTRLQAAFAPDTFHVSAALAGRMQTVVLDLSTILKALD